MRKPVTAIILLAAVATGGCAGMFGKRAAPDEFAVARNAPLVIPPDFTLAPPAAGTAGLSPTDAQAQAIEALFGGPAPRSQAEVSLLEQAGREYRIDGTGRLPELSHPAHPVEERHREAPVAEQMVVEKIEVPARQPIDLVESRVDGLRVERAPALEERLLVAEVADVRAAA